jgi:hypothetical protein
MVEACNAVSQFLHYTSLFIISLFSQMADVWQLIQPTVAKCLPDKNLQLPVNGTSPSNK